MARGLTHGVGDGIIEGAKLFVPELAAWDEFVVNRDRDEEVWFWR